MLWDSKVCNLNLNKSSGVNVIDQVILMAISKDFQYHLSFKKMLSDFLIDFNMFKD